MFEEKSELIQISLFPKTKTVIARWCDQVIKDGVVISEKDRHSGYDETTKDELLAEVEGAEAYLTPLGWA